MDEAQSRIAEIASGAVEAYSGKAAFRVAITAIPWIGGPMDALLSTKGQGIVQRRIMSLIDTLRAELTSVRENQIDRSFIESEDFFDLIVRTIEAASRTSEQEKIGLFALILKGAAVGRREVDFSGEDAVRIVLDLTPRQIEVARAVYDQQHQGPGNGENNLQWALRAGWNGLAGSLSGFGAEETKTALLMLQRAGLVQEVTGAYYDYAGGVFVITPVFKRLMTYLTGPVS